MSGKAIARDLRSWHQRHFPEWYKAMPTAPVFNNEGHHIGYKLIDSYSNLTSRDAEFEQIMRRLETDGE